MPQWLVNKEEDMDRLLDEQLGKLDVSRLDFTCCSAQRAAFTKLQKLNKKF